MARNRKNKFRKRQSVTIPMGIVGGFAVPVVHAYDANKIGGIKAGIADFSKSMSGFDPYTGAFAVQNMKMGFVPVMTGFAVHQIASAVGINRMLGRAGVPLIRI